MQYQKPLNLELSPSARNDLEDIAQYTFLNYSEAQMDSYIGAIQERFILLAENPEIGHFHDDLPESCKVFPVEKHVIVYQVKQNNLYIIRVLHGHMDFTNQDLS